MNFSLAQLPGFEGPTEGKAGPETQGRTSEKFLRLAILQAEKCILQSHRDPSTSLQHNCLVNV
jgi:hypothetical protein